MVNWIPVKAIDWLLYNHTYIREKVESDEFAVRPCVLEGLGGIGRVSSSVPPDPVEDYTITKQKYIAILDAIDFTLQALELFEFNIYWYKWQKRMTTKEMFRIFSDPRNVEFTVTSVPTINRRIVFIRSLAQVIVSMSVEERDVIGMMRRFGPEVEKNKRNGVN